MMKLRDICLLVSLMALALVLASFQARAEENADGTIGFVTGPKTGTYIALGHDIAAVAKTAGLKLVVKESDGSIDNIKRISSEENAGLGIVQSDVLGFLSRSRNPESQRIAEKLRMVFPLNREEVHVLARKDIKRFSDLQGKKVVVGDEGSGSLLTSVNLFSLLGITPAEMVKIAPPEGVVAVLQKEADAMIFVGGKPVRLFKNLEQLRTAESGSKASLLDQVHFLPLDDPKLLKEYSQATLTHDDYSFVQESLPTLAVTSVLVTYDFAESGSDYHKARCQDLRTLGNAVRQNIAYLRANGHPKWKEIDPDARPGIWKRDLCSWQDSGRSATTTRELQQDLLKIIQQSGDGK